MTIPVECQMEKMEKKEGVGREWGGSGEGGSGEGSEGGGGEGKEACEQGVFYEEMKGNMEHNLSAHQHTSPLYVNNDQIGGRGGRGKGGEGGGGGRGGGGIYDEPGECGKVTFSKKCNYSYSAKVSKTDHCNKCTLLVYMQHFTH